MRRTRRRFRRPEVQQSHSRLNRRGGGAEIEKALHGGGGRKQKRHSREEQARIVGKMVVGIVAHQIVAEHVDADVRAHRGKKRRREDGQDREAQLQSVPYAGGGERSLSSKDIPAR